MTVSHAPIAVFAYNRPDHLASTLQSLIACDGADASPITVFIDGPKSEAGAEATEQVRQVAADVLGTAADIRVAPENRGLSRSIVGGVGALLDQYGTAIVVEDDLALAPCFLDFLNDALRSFELAENVYQISGHMYDVPEFAHRDEGVFLPLTTTWGWATWGRAWRAYDSNATGWERLRHDRRLRRRFDLDGSYPYTLLMERQQQGRSDSWGIRWYWSVFQRGGLTLFPPRTLVSNTGQDGSGTHGGGIVNNFGGGPSFAERAVPRLPAEAAADPSDVEVVRKAIWRQNGAWKGWAFNKLREHAGF